MYQPSLVKLGALITNCTLSQINCPKIFEGQNYLYVSMDIVRKTDSYVYIINNVKLIYRWFILYSAQMIPVFF